MNQVLRSSVKVLADLFYKIVLDQLGQSQILWKAFHLVIYYLSEALWGCHYLIDV